MDRESPDFLPLLSSLTADEDRALTTKLRGDDARVVLGRLDEVLKGGTIPDKYDHDTLLTMQTLACSSGQVPPRYKIDRRSFNVEPCVVACGGSADIREGMLGDKTVAVKTLRIGRSDDLHEAQKRFCKECIIWMNISHPNLLELVAIDVDPLTCRYSMISEMMMNGNLKEYIQKNPANRHRLLEEAATGLHYLHKRGIVHGDLKGKNILITNGTPPRACLADFGLSTLVPGAQEAMAGVAAGGTPMFMAPELLFPAKFNKLNARPMKPADIYAFGMVIYEVLTGFWPFYEKQWGEYDLLYHVITGVRPTKPDDVEQIGSGDGTWKLVEECWIEESARRPTIDQVLTHLTRVAAYSKVVGPTPDRPYESAVNSAASDFSTQIQWPSSATTIIRHGEFPQNAMISTVRLEPWETALAAFLRVRWSGNVDSQRMQAQEFVDKLDAALENRGLHGQKRKQYQRSLRKLCGGFCILPSSFALAPKSIKCETRSFASGGFSRVYEGTFKGQPVAIKTLKVDGATDREKLSKLLVKEVVGWKWLQHKNILPFIGVTSTPPPISIVSARMENGNIMDFIRTHPKHNRLDLLIGAATGLEYLHSRGVVHGDLKGANVLVDSGCCARLADFGLAMVIDESTAGYTHSGEGTTRWMAPELLLPENFGFTDKLAKRLPNKSTDVYAIGMTILEVITGSPPFNNIPRRETVIFKVVQGDRPDRPSPEFSDTLWDLLAKTWETEDGPQSQRRPSTSFVRDRLQEDRNEWGKSIVSLCPEFWQKGAMSSDGTRILMEANAVPATPLVHLSYVDQDENTQLRSGPGRTAKNTKKLVYRFSRWLRLFVIPQRRQLRKKREDSRLYYRPITASCAYGTLDIQFTIDPESLG